MLKKKVIEYMGIEHPETLAQLEVEICGLRHAVKMAEEQICRLEQAAALVKLQIEEGAKKQD